MAKIRRVKRGRAFSLDISFLAAFLGYCVGSIQGGPDRTGLVLTTLQAIPAVSFMRPVVENPCETNSGQTEKRPIFGTEAEDLKIRNF